MHVYARFLSSCAGPHPVPPYGHSWLWFGLEFTPRPLRPAAVGVEGRQGEAEYAAAPMPVPELSCSPPNTHRALARAGSLLLRTVVGPTPARRYLPPLLPAARA